jgi:hypothetical protein
MWFVVKCPRLNSTRGALQHITTPTSRPTSITIARPRISRPAIHETLPQRQQFALIGRDELRSNRVPPAAAQWLYLHADPEPNPESDSAQCKISFSNVAVKAEQVSGTRGGDRRTLRDEEKKQPN